MKKIFLIVAFLLWAWQADAAITRVQTGGTCSGASSTTCVMTLTSAVAGHMIVVGLAWNGSSTTITSITVSGESNMTLAGSPTTSAMDGGVASQNAYLCNIVNSGTKTITVTFSGTTNGSGISLEYTGQDTASCFDVDAGASGTAGSGGSNTPFNITTTAANDAILITFNGQSTDANTTIPSGFTTQEMPNPYESCKGADLEDTGAAGAKTYNWVFAASSAQYILKGTAFKAAGGGGGGGASAIIHRRIQ